MAKNIPDSFSIFKSNLDIIDLHQSKISSRQLIVRGVLEEEFDVKQTFLSGSYSRNTIISPLKQAEIDVFVVLDPTYFSEEGQVSLLDRVKRVLQKMYSESPEISKNGQAVTLTFSDFIINVIPAFNRQDGGYFIPDSIESKWIITDPKLHVALICEANSEHNGDLVPLIKMVKGWNRVINSPFSSFHLEVMVYQLLKNTEIQDYPMSLLYFFDEGRQYVRKQNLDPAGYGGDIGSYIKARHRMEEAQRRFETAYKSAYKAIYYWKNAHAENSINEWRKIFGNYFPAYG